jgi:hypothetical protein
MRRIHRIAASDRNGIDLALRVAGCGEPRGGDHYDKRAAGEPAPI